MEKILININTQEEIEYYKEIGITNFLFPIDKFSIGYKAFSLNDIPDDSYILVNRVMDTKTIGEFKNLIPELQRFKGVFFEDVGVYHLLRNSNLELIWFQNHFGTNYNSINEWLELGCDSAVISNEITKYEIDEILANTSKPLVLTRFAKNQIMYSRRTLLTNFNKYNNLPQYNDMELDVIHNECVFEAKENEFGTIIYNNEYFNYINVNFNEDKIKLNLILNLDLKKESIKEILNGKQIGNNGFLNKKTVYKLADYGDK